MASPAGVRFDGVRIGASDLDEGVRLYGALLGVDAVRLHSGAWRFQLDRGAVEIAAGASGLEAIRLLAPAPWAERLDFNGLKVEVAVVVEAPGTSRGAMDTAPGPSRGAADAAPASGYATSHDPSRAVRDTGPARDAVVAIDHVVIQCADPERAIALWRDRLDVRLALDREFPARGLRMLFFRSASMTLEFVSPLGARDPEGKDALNGVAYVTNDVEACRTRLLAAGLDVSEVRAGFKAGTRVATVRSGTLGVPTLLIDHPARAEAQVEG